MLDDATFSCPSCGASLTVPKQGNHVRCPYCNNTVIVPEALRPTTSAIDEMKIVIGQMPSMDQPRPLGNQPRVIIAGSPVVRRGGSSLGAIMGLVFALVALGVAGFFMFATQETGNIFPTLGASILTTARSSFSVQPSPTPGPTRTPGPPTATPVPGYGDVLLSFGEKGTGPGFFDDPRAVSVDNKGNLYVADYTSGRIQRFDEKGNYQSEWKLEGKYPLIFDIAADRNGNVYVAQGGRILKYNGSAGTLLATFGLSTSFYRDVSVLASGELLALIGSASDDDLVRLNAQGRELSRIRKIVSAQTDEPEGALTRMTVDGLGNVYIASSISYGVFRYSPEGKFVNRFGSRAEGGSNARPGQFAMGPSAIAVDGQSRIYVPDFQGIQVFDKNGTYLSQIALPSRSGAVREMAITDKSEMFLTTSNNQVYKILLRGK